MDGIINVYKERGFTSFDVVAKLRGILHQKKIGHTGTLDPAAEGVLPVCVGHATRACSMLQDHDKIYRAVMRLGITTDTEDSTGEILEERPVECTEEQIRSAAASFVKSFGQVPPMYSAIKVDGKHLYELARKGRVVEREERPVTIYRIDVTKIELPLVEMEVSCSKGTYIRSLCRDIGEMLGCGACMDSLLRVKTGVFDLATAKTLDEIEKIRDEGKIPEILIPVGEIFPEYPALTVEGDVLHLAYNGNTIDAAQIPCEEERVRLFDPQKHFLGIYERHGDRMKPFKMFLDQDQVKVWKEQASAGEVSL